MFTERLLSRRELLGAAAATGAGALGLVACRNGEDTTGTPEPGVTLTPKRGGTVRTATSVVYGLDPMTTEGIAFGAHFYSVLVQLTDWQGTVGDLALSWENPDPLEWVFRLRDDVRFQDVPPANGRTLVAEDIAYSLDRAQSMPGAAASWEEWVERYEARGPTEFYMRTRTPYAYLLWLTSICAVVPREAVEEFGDLNNHAVGSGPFMLSDYSRDRGVDRVRNPLYYHDFPYIEGYSTRALGDEGSIQAAFRAGSIDVYDAASKIKADAVANVPGITVSRYIDRRYACLRLNGSKFEPFRDQRVREAIDLSLDRKSMIEKLHFGDAEIAGPVPPAFTSALPGDEVEAAYEYDPAKARQLLSAAGMEDLRFELSVGSYLDMPDQAAVVKEHLAEAGITVDIRVGELTSWLANMLNGNFQMTVFNHLDYLTDEIPLQSHHTYGSSRVQRDYLGVEDAQVDAILDKAQQTLDEGERNELAREAQRLVLKRHGPTLHLYQPYGYWCAYDYLKGYTPGAFGFGLFKFDYWIDKD